MMALHADITGGSVMPGADQVRSLGAAATHPRRSSRFPRPLVFVFVARAAFRPARAGDEAVLN